MDQRLSKVEVVTACRYRIGVGYWDASAWAASWVSSESSVKTRMTNATDCSRLP
jgi:hypothetical protein